LNIQTVEDFKKKKKMGVIKVPSFDNLNALCKQNKGGRKFEEFFFVNSEKLNKLIDEDLIERIKKWCKKNNINSQVEYLSFKGKPKDFPTRAMIMKNYGEKWFSEALELTKYKPRLQDKLLNEEFMNSIKEWCIKNNIDSISKYAKTKKPKWMPSHERIRQIYGNEYFKQVLGIKYEFLSKEEVEKLKNEIISLYKKGIKQVEISKKMNVSQRYVSLVIKSHKIMG